MENMTVADISLPFSLDCFHRTFTQSVTVFRVSQFRLYLRLQIAWLNKPLKAMVAVAGTYLFTCFPQVPLCMWGRNEPPPPNMQNLSARAGVRKVQSHGLAENTFLWLPAGNHWFLGLFRFFRLWVSGWWSGSHRYNCRLWPGKAGGPLYHPADMD